MLFSITEKIIVTEKLRQTMLSSSAGAYCSYEGWVRDHNEGKDVNSLHYSAYEKLAQTIGCKMLHEAESTYQVESAIVHRVVDVSVADIAVWVGVTAHHRGDTFLACRYRIDNIKHRLPVWKKEVYSNGEERWIDNNHCGCSDPKNLQF